MNHRTSKPSAVYKKDQERASLGVSSLLWLLVGVVIIVVAGSILYLSPLFASFHKTAAPVDETVVTTPDEPEKKIEFEFYEVLPEQDFHSVPEGVSVQDQQANTHTIAKPDAVVRPAKPTSTTKKTDEQPKTQQSQDSTLTADDANDGNTADNHDNKDDAKTTYILQIRSYTNADEADVKRAEVLMSGVDAVVVRRDDGANGTHFYQVVSTPMASQEAASLAYQKLKNNGIDALIVEQKH
ncbi:SPOR domain-containing protein [Moraxella sp.]|uniref:SPOR domain-containing protein n=1 Tax=Moraxella sp. TaxID=479 RepID=UPI0026DB19B3|nr:SPOR domain-containing protein [Moraxella sp.]MDO4894761.1 SPOR domain-containing protein [Moraxella sp.]